MQHSRATHHKVLCRKPSVAFNLHARASVKACTCEGSIRKASNAGITHTHTTHGHCLLEPTQCHVLSPEAVL